MASLEDVSSGAKKTLEKSQDLVKDAGEKKVNASVPATTHEFSYAPYAMARNVGKYEKATK